MEKRSITIETFRYMHSCRRAGKLSHIGAESFLQQEVKAEELHFKSLCNELLKKEELERSKDILFDVRFETDTAVARIDALVKRKDGKNILVKYRYTTYMPTKRDF